MIAPKIKAVGAYHAKTHLSALLKEVARGREIIITHREKPIARLVPIESEALKNDIYDQILAFHGRITLPKGETSLDLIKVGRKW